MTVSMETWSSPDRLLAPATLFLLLLLFSTALNGGARAADVALGSTLFASAPNATWSSSDNTFSFGFTPSPDSTSSFVAGVSFNGVSVWQAGGPGLLIDSAASLHLNQSGDLQLLDASEAILWSSRTSALGVTSASLDDSGNFMLLNGTLPVWSTFDNPTDSLVPSQNFTVNKVLRSGEYSLNLTKSGNMTLKWNDNIEYWSLGLNSTYEANLTWPTLSILPIGTLTISDDVLSSPVTVVYSSDYAEGTSVFRFLRLDSDGNLRIYSSSGSSVAINQRWSAVPDQCQVFGYCGNFGICSYNDSNPVCGCPSMNFDLIDSKDSRKGCKRKLEISNCTQSIATVDLEHTKFMTYPPESSSQVISSAISACRLNCLTSTPCVASTALSDGSGMCYSKTTDFISGYQSPSLPSTSYLKVCGQPLLNPTVSPGDSVRTNRWRLPVWVVIVAVLGTLIGLILLEGGLWWWCCRNNPKFGTLSAQYALLEYASGAPVQFSYKELQKSTKGFKEKLGEGGFGAVYRGTLANKTVVAVKQLEGIEQGEKQFRMEVATISSTHHLNLVRLIGFCSEGRHRLLVYEFMKNGSLDNFLFASEERSGRLLNWEVRFGIALGTARGITYLHEECRDCIVHCDIKPENILLDENYNAKVSDFGLAKLVNPKDHRYRTLTSVRGTRGYLAPEWLANLPITSKSDVYSYGMVLLEIVSGRRNFDVSNETGRKKFSIWAYEEYEKGNVQAIMDKRIWDNDVNIQQVMRAVEVSFWCIQEQPSHRPMMGRVVQMLEGVSAIEKPPAPKAAVTDGSASTSINVSSSVSALSILAPSAPGPSSTSSLQATIPSVSGRTFERVSSSLMMTPTRFEDS
uniref:Receptor-like serine/threonine-protein kinase n=1 Tax=Kalanchoe fedtschenkoi TaxID=63787 RepID=A0A7N0U9E2_KALFE